MRSPRPTPLPQFAGETRDEPTRWLAAYRRLQALDALAHQLRLEGLGEADGRGHEDHVVTRVETDARELRARLEAWEERLRALAN